MRLYSRFLGGAGRRIVILHGLFGSSRNWISAGRRLAGRGAVYALDLRNHGESPHADSHSLADMVGDVEEWLATEGSPAEPAVLLGHSMGGQVAMALALQRPHAVAALVVVDVAPRAYRKDYAAEFAALSVDVSAMQRRSEVEEAMASFVPDEEARRFLAMNAVRSGRGFRWQLNVEALRRARIMEEEPDFRGRYEGPALFLAGGRSHWISPDDHRRIAELFPRAAVQVIEGANHWVHASAPEAFHREVDAFLAAAEGEPAASGQGRGGLVG